MSCSFYEDQIDPAIIDMICSGDVIKLQKALKEGLSPNLEDYHHGSILFVAVAEGQDKVAQVLVDYGADPFLCNDCHVSAFEFAVKESRFKLAEYFTTNCFNEYVKDFCLLEYQDMEKLLVDESIFKLLLKRGARIDVMTFLRFHLEPGFVIGALESLSPKEYEHTLYQFSESLVEFLTWGNIEVVSDFIYLTENKVPAFCSSKIDISDKSVETLKVA